MLLTSASCLRHQLKHDRDGCAALVDFSALLVGEKTAFAPILQGKDLRLADPRRQRHWPVVSPFVGNARHLGPAHDDELAKRARCLRLKAERPGEVDPRLEKDRRRAQDAVKVRNIAAS